MYTERTQSLTHKRIECVSVENITQTKNTAGFGEHTLEWSIGGPTMLLAGYEHTKHTRWARRELQFTFDARGLFLFGRFNENTQYGREFIPDLTYERTGRQL